MTLKRIAAARPLRAVLVGVLVLPWAELRCGATGDPMPEYSFGLSLRTGMNNELFTLFEVKELNSRILEAKAITRGQFVMQAQGAIPSRANPAGDNLFRTHGVSGCLLPEGLDDGRRVVPDCGVFDELWKLRFWEYPFVQREGQHPGLGWAESHTRPSERQQLLLCGYGLCTPTDLACGEDMFRLLRDVEDPAWVDNYRKGY